MSSFTDDILHYNPYVTQLPTDDYINAGLQLQSRYNEGVQRTQNFLDSVNGLEIAGDANRQYLRNKVSELEGKVAKVAGSDFAKTSVSSQVSRLAGMIYKDPIVQAGMSSAIRISQYQKAWEDMQKNHPEQYSGKNKEYFDQYVNDYMKQSQGKAGLVYNGPTGATPYVDYYTKLDKELKGLDPTISTSIGANGQFQYRIDKSSVVSQDKILGVVNSVLASDPNIGQQMQIDAWHAYRSFDEKGMFNHINDAFGNMIESHRANAQYWEGVIKNNPNDFEAINVAQRKIIDSNTQIKSLSSNRDGYLQAINEGKLDQVKQSAFNDSIRQGLVLKYEKSNIESDFKSNQNAIQAQEGYYKGRRDWLDYVGNGFDPATGKPLQPGDPLYAGFLNANYGKNKKGKDGKENAEDDLQPVSMAGVVGETYTQDMHTQRIAQVEANMSDLTKKLRDLKGKDFASDSGFQTYLQTQEGKYQQGDAGIDPDYALYRSKMQVDKALHDTYVNNATQIYNDAAANHQLQSQLQDWTTFKNIDIAGSNGKVTKGNIVADKGIVQAALDVRNTVLNKPSGVGFQPGQLVYGALPLNNKNITQKDFEEAAAKYKNDPKYASQYNKILSIARSTDLDNIANQNFTILKARDNQIKQGFANYGLTTSYRGLPFEGKKEYIDYAKRLVAAAVGENGATEGQGGAKGLKQVNAEDVNPIAYYNDDLGKVHVRYQVGKGADQYDTVVPDRENILGNPDPYQPYARMIEMDANHSTPVEANQALSTNNGKIKYIIRKNVLSGHYEGRFYYKGALYTIPSWAASSQDAYERPNIGSYVEKFEELSKLPPEQVETLIKNTFNK